MQSPVFVPPALRIRKLRAESDKNTPQFVFAWEREDGCFYRFAMPIPASRESDPAVLQLAERCVKTVLWAAGGWKLWLSGPAAVCDFVEAAYAAGGPRQFDRDMMERVYDRPMTTQRCGADEVPQTRDKLQTGGTSWQGCRIGFDLGASDFKIAAVEEGEVRFNDEFPWDPRNATDPDYHYNMLSEGLRKAAEHLPRVDAIGGSSAGIVVANRLRVASLLRAIPAEHYAEAQSLFKRVEADWKVPVEVANDGDVTALAAYLTEGSTGVLGVAMGSSEAVGFIDRAGALTGRLNELAFAPVDLAPDAPADEWSGDTGVGAMYFSQDAVNRLALHYGLKYEDSVILPERLVDIQNRMIAGEAVAKQIYVNIGTYLGHAIAWYHEFYDYSDMLVLGRVTTGSGGDLLLETAIETVKAEYPDLADLKVRMPDEKAKRLGQSVAAAAIARE